VRGLRANNRHPAGGLELKKSASSLEQTANATHVLKTADRQAYRDFVFLPVELASQRIKMTPAASISFFEPRYNNFLQAAIGVENNEMQLSVLSALARLDVDPWAVAAELSGLSQSVATQRLSSLLMRLPGGRWSWVDSGLIANRLVQLLPHTTGAVAQPVRENGSAKWLTGSIVAQFLIIAVFAATLVLGAQIRFHSEAPPQTTHDAPLSASSASPP
jgi:hypothetical protein